MTSEFNTSLSARAVEIEQMLDSLLPPSGKHDLFAAMRHGVLNGGKRLRGYLVCESGRLFDAEPDGVLRAAAAIECLHAYSLVHDDLPCMDDDDLRRGKPTVHVVWGEAMGVLVGDALQSMAFEILSDPATCSDESRRLKLVLTLAQAAGAQGMVLGQAQDIAAESSASPLSLEQIKALQANKTGALIRWSAEAGALLGGANTDAMIEYATALGLAFQIQDDVLDVEGSAETAGKRVGKDAHAGKATFVSLLGLDAAKKAAAELVVSACDAVNGYGSRASNLQELAKFVIARSK